MNKDPFTIPIWPGTPPGSENWTQQERQYHQPGNAKYSFIRNVTQPELIAYLPDPAINTGTAMIVCPGGALHLLAIDFEGHDVARWLCERGIAGFVLKYRLVESSPVDADFEAHMARLMEDLPTLKAITRPHEPLAVADGLQAIRTVRQHADEWRINPQRIGIMGFSAGGFVTTGSALRYNADSRPNFAAPIYGAMWEDLPVPADAPPLFIALAADDPLAVDPALRLFNAWQAAGRSAELHIYAHGGHGFGMQTQQISTDTWIDRLGDWLDDQGLLDPADGGS